MRLRLLAPLLVLAALVTPSRAGERLQFLHVGPVSGPSGLRQVTDEDGRTVLLRGVNVNGLVDYRTPSFRPPYPTGPEAYADGRCPADSRVTTAVPLCEKDLDEIAALGMGVVRLPVSWSLLEPTPGHLDRTPFDRIAQVVGWARARGLRIVIDLHQDAWSKYVVGTGPCPPGSSPATGEDGAPAWASLHLTPACALGGTKELDTAVQEAAQRFWLDLPASDGVGLQEHYAAVVTALARRFASDPAVAGYEVMNEPQPGFAPVAMDGTELMAFQGKVVDAVVKAVPGFRQLFFVEPGGTRNVTAARTFVQPWSTYSSYPNVVYAPHVYSQVFTADTSGIVQSFDSDYAAAVGDARALGLPLWVGEFGNDPSADATVLTQHFAHQDADAIGSALWVWKEHGSWSAATRGPAVARAYPLATAGVLDGFASHGRSFEVRAHGHGTSVVVVPYAAKLSVTGAHIRRSGDRVLVTATGAWELTGA